MGLAALSSWAARACRSGPELVAAQALLRWHLLHRPGNSDPLSSVAGAFGREFASFSSPRALAASGCSVVALLALDPNVSCSFVRKPSGASPSQEERVPTRGVDASVRSILRMSEHAGVAQNSWQCKLCFVGTSCTGQLPVLVLVYLLCRAAFVYRRMSQHSAVSSAQSMMQ